uniref:Sushi domain-containing protein n=1 Tax=Scleropages formosus TaxID=113540 RepID=A0A8C9UYQ3_SCLFO
VVQTITTLSRECPYNTLFLYFSAKEKLCNKPPINQGYIYPVKTTYNNEEILYYACITGYKPTTEGWWGHITCTNRAWSHNPKCIEIRCPKPIIANSIHIYGRNFYKNNDILRFVCEENYTPVGNENTRCTKNGWSQQPKCEAKRLSCKELPTIENGDRISEKQEGDLYKEVTFQCPRSYKLEGKEIVRCRNGNWEELPKCLKPCAIENIPEKHHLEKLPSTVYVEEGKTYRFTCKSRYYKDTWYWSTNVEGICKNGHMEFPTCK